MRLFLAIHLPDEVKGRLIYAQQHWNNDADEYPPVSWTRAENLHLTLKFFGEVDEAQAMVLSETLAGATKPGPFALRTESMEYFPSRGPIRILAVQVGGELDKLAALHREIEERCEEIGFAPEDREFKPHITIGRSRNGLPGFLRHGHRDKLWPEPSPAFEVKQISLMKSDLKPKGPEYREIQAFSL